MLTALATYALLGVLIANILLVIYRDDPFFEIKNAVNIAAFWPAVMIGFALDLAHLAAMIAKRSFRALRDRFLP